MKPIWYFVSIALTAFLLVSCQPTHQKQNNNSNASLLNEELQTTFEMPPNIPNMGTGSLQRSVNRYWNLVSFPVETTQSIQSFLETQDYANQIQSVWSWDKSLGESGSWKVFPQTDDFEILENISPDNGYWIRARNSFDFSGTGVSENLYNFSVGWNLIGVSHSQIDTNITDFFTQGDFWKDSCGTGATYDSVWSWQDNTWKVHFAETGKLEEFNNQQGTSFEELVTLESGMGVWINTLRANTPPPPEGCGNSGDDHGNNTDSATPVSLGIETSGTLETSDDFDYFSFTADSSDVYVFESFGSTYVYVDLYGSDSSLITSNFDGKGDGNFLLYYLLEAGQTYFFSASGFQEGSYSVAVTKSVDEHGDDFASATALELSNPINAIMNSVSDMDYFSFTPVSSGTYTFLTTGSLDTFALLYDPNENELVEDEDSGFGTNISIAYQLEANQTYFFKIMSNAQHIGSYSIFVLPQSNSALEGKWYNSEDKVYYQITSDFTIFSCREEFLYWEQPTIIGNLMFYDGIFRGDRLSVSDNKFIIAINDLEIQHEAVSEPPQSCADLTNTFFQTPPSYQGFWFNLADTYERYYRIDENNVIQDCEAYSEESYGSSEAGTIINNVAKFPNFSLLLNLSNDVLSVRYQYDLTVEYIRLSSVPVPCGTFFDEN